MYLYLKPLCLHCLSLEEQPFTSATWIILWWAVHTFWDLRRRHYSEKLEAFPIQTACDPCLNCSSLEEQPLTSANEVYFAKWECNSDISKRGQRPFTFGCEYAVFQHIKIFVAYTRVAKVSGRVLYIATASNISVSHTHCTANENERNDIQPREAQFFRFPKASVTDVKWQTRNWVPATFCSTFDINPKIILKMYAA